MCFFFQHGFFKPYGPKKAIYPPYVYDFFNIFGRAILRRRKPRWLKKVWDGFGKGLEGFGNLDVDFEILEMPVLGAKLSSRDQGCASSQLDHGLKV